MLGGGGGGGSHEGSTSTSPTHARGKAVPATATAAAASAAAAAALAATPPAGGGSPLHSTSRPANATKGPAGGGAGAMGATAPPQAPPPHAGEAMGHRRSNSGGATGDASVGRVALGAGGGVVSGGSVGVAGRRVPVSTDVHENPHFPGAGRAGSSVLYQSKPRRAAGASGHSSNNRGGGAAAAATQPPQWVKHGEDGGSSSRARTSGAGGKELSDQVLKRISPAHSLSRSPSPERGGRRSGSDWAAVWAQSNGPAAAAAAPHGGSARPVSTTHTRAGLAARSESLDETQGWASVPPPALPLSGARAAAAGVFVRVG